MESSNFKDFSIQGKNLFKKVFLKHTELTKFLQNSRCFRQNKSYEL